MRIFSSYRRLLSDIVLMWIIYWSGSWLFQFATTLGELRVGMQIHRLHSIARLVLMETYL